MDQQQVAFGRFNAVAQFVAVKALGGRDGRGDALAHGLLECGLLAGLDADVDDFQNHA
ncbi:hypothetical protein D3C85_1846790 [compost metagenome]